ncbi:MAG: hypothetical protein JWN66_1121 [Sphingomonas bacterium]|uniref:hypothetical protein n=1 Tax=Sphingomonas bacterium TaxID=1895847 RepID=UPI002617EC56|nr:hypothetical protein [Sphingomonas bacterium]MDB5704005.1 hypothetical protein [Sphingomonas bacterium]
MRMILPAGTVAMLALLALSACSTPEAMTRSGLVNAGIDQRTAACMADRMVHRLSLLQLRRLAGLGKVERSRNLEQLLHRARSLNDPEIVGVTASSAALCATGLAGIKL